MQEKLLNFIWQHQLYSAKQLKTTEGEAIQLIKSGFINENAGPDFLHACIKIGAVTWNGAVEIHINSNDWDTHGHQNDKAYNKVILHVVWKHTKEVKRQDNTLIPTLELAPIVPFSFIEKAEHLLNNLEPIACASQIHNVNAITRTQEIERKLIERLERKASHVLQLLAINKGDWSETVYQSLMKQMGMKVNSHAFETLATKLPYRLIKKYAEKTLQVEALLFGVAGLLPKSSLDNYEANIIKEFEFLKIKHSITYLMEAQQWKFLRLRPANFPTLRLAQAASILASKQSLFEHLVAFKNSKELMSYLKGVPSEYWSSHYRFGKVSNTQIGGMGTTALHLLLLNVAAPLLVAYSIHAGNQSYMEKALHVMQSLPPEKNKITRAWAKMDVLANTGAESQGLIELFNENCKEKKCLSCGIGFAVVHA